MKVNGDLQFRQIGFGELKNAIIERLASDPVIGGSPPVSVAGRIYYNTTSNSYFYFDGTAWTEFAAGTGDVSNIIVSGGYMFGDGTFDASEFNGFANVDPTGSPFLDLVDVLAQLDSAISFARAVDTLAELTDTDIGEASGSPLANNGALLQFRSADGKWVETSVVGLVDNFIITWNAAQNLWVPTANTTAINLPNLTDVADDTTSSALEGQVLQFNSTGSPANRWRNSFIPFLRDNVDGRTNIDLTGGALDPESDGNSILFDVDVSGTGQQVAAFTTSGITLTGPNKLGTGSPVSSGDGGFISLLGGYGTATGSPPSAEGGAISIAGGQGYYGNVNGGPVTIDGGAGLGTSVGGSVDINAGTAGASGGDGGNVSLTSGPGFPTGSPLGGTCGYVKLQGAKGAVDNVDGGFVQIRAGAGFSAYSYAGTGDGGIIDIRGGSSAFGAAGSFTGRGGFSTNGVGGSINIYAGTSLYSTAGNARLASGNSTSGTPGNVVIFAGYASNPGSVGGKVDIDAGNAPDGGGAVEITAGDGTGVGADGGDVTISGGYSTLGSGGNINLVPGTGASQGHVLIGTTGTEAAELRFGEVDGSPQSYIAVKAPDTLTSSILYELPDEIIVGSPAIATFLLGIDTLITGGATANKMKWVTGGGGGGAGNMVQYIYDSTLAAPVGSPLGSPPNTARTTHTIAHNIGQEFVGVTVYDVTGVQIVPESTTLVDASNLTVTFTLPIDCTVVIMGDPTISPSDGT